MDLFRNNELYDTALGTLTMNYLPFLNRLIIQLSMLFPDLLTFTLKNKDAKIEFRIEVVSDNELVESISAFVATKLTAGMEMYVVDQPIVFMTNVIIYLSSSIHKDMFIFSILRQVHAECRHILLQRDELISSLDVDMLYDFDTGIIEYTYGFVVYPFVVTGYVTQLFVRMASRLIRFNSNKVIHFETNETEHVHPDGYKSILYVLRIDTGGLLSDTFLIK